MLANKSTLNAKKSNYVIFHPYQRKIQSVINIKVFDNEHNAFRNLDRKQFVKYLGVLIDSNLSWNDHVANVALKISKTIGNIARLRHFLPTSVLLNICNSLIHPSLLWPCGLGPNFKNKSWKNLDPSEKSSTLNLLL